MCIYLKGNWCSVKKSICDSWIMYLPKVTISVIYVPCWYMGVNPTSLQTGFEQRREIPETGGRAMWMTCAQSWRKVKLTTSLSTSTQWMAEGEMLEEVECEDGEKKIDRCLTFLDSISIIKEKWISPNVRELSGKMSEICKFKSCQGL